MEINIYQPNCCTVCKRKDKHLFFFNPCQESQRRPSGFKVSFVWNLSLFLSLIVLSFDPFNTFLPIFITHFSSAADNVQKCISYVLVFTRHLVSLLLYFKFITSIYLCVWVDSLLPPCDSLVISLRSSGYGVCASTCWATSTLLLLLIFLSVGKQVGVCTYMETRGTLGVLQVSRSGFISLRKHFYH